MVVRHDTVVIGGGQAGLAMSAVLRDCGRDHIVLERSRVAERWRSERWDSLRFQFPNWSIALPGFRYTGTDPDGFATAAEIAGLIKEYAVQAPVREHTEVVSLRRVGEEFSITTTDGLLHARQVVVATGPFQRPRIPSLASELPAHITQMDPTRYRNPDGLPPGSVLVIGAGASGIQIAEELIGAGRTVFLAASRHRRIPRRFRGRDVYWWLDRMGRFEQTIDTFLDRRWPPHTAVTGVNGGYDIDLRRLASGGSRVVGSVRGVSGTRLVLADNTNQILNDADAAYLSFIEAARAFAASARGIAGRRRRCRPERDAGTGSRRDRHRSGRNHQRYLGDRVRIRLQLAARGRHRFRQAPHPTARRNGNTWALLPRPALDAHIQIRLAVRRRR